MSRSATSKHAVTALAEVSSWNVWNGNWKVLQQVSGSTPEGTRKNKNDCQPKKSFEFPSLKGKAVNQKLLLFLCNKRTKTCEMQKYFRRPERVEKNFKHRHLSSTGRLLLLAGVITQKYRELELLWKEIHKKTNASVSILSLMKRKNKEESQCFFGFILKMEAIHFSETSSNTRHITKWLVVSVSRVAKWHYRVSKPAFLYV